MGHDFDGTAAAALGSALTLLPRWMGGRQQGTEWVGERRANGGIGDSWSVNLTTGVWSHFATGKTGCDLIALFGELYHVSMNTARLEIERQLGANGHDVPVLPVRAPAPDRIDDEPIELIPADAPPLKDHPTHGAPSAEYRYGDHFVVQRFDFLDSQGEPDKTFVQWSWRGGAWAKRGTKAPQPLYHAHLLKASPTSPVLVVEGEKCVEMAQPLLGIWVVTTWAGGAGAIKKADWSLLKGRDVTIWPDADTPGREAGAKIAALLANTAARVRTVNPNGADPGWDIAEAIESGWDKTKLIAWMSDHMAPVIEAPKKSPATATPIARIPADESAVLLDRPDSAANTSAPINWVSLGLDCDHKQQPYITLANASKILQFYENFQGSIWYDDFRGRVYHTLSSAVPQPWTDRETRRVTVAIQQQLQLPKFQLNLVNDAITHAAECHPRHSLRDWLDSLKWDGITRLDDWLGDAAGVTLDEYTQAVGRNWLIGMVARAYRPGCKMDNMPVLEGISGLKKTQFLQVLGGEWYKSLTMQFGEKDFLQALRGAWLVEIPDMAGFTRSEHTKVLATITTATDSYRVPYGRVPEDVPRTCVFAATSETDDYLSDSRGKRRYWPIRCTDINLDTLRHQRDQLFAEARERYRNNATWYEVPIDAATREQLDRTEPDEFASDIIALAEIWWREYVMNPVGNKITAKRLLMRVLGIERPIDITAAQCRRVTKALQSTGTWRRKRDDYGFHWIKYPR